MRTGNVNVNMKSDSKICNYNMGSYDMWQGILNKGRESGIYIINIVA